MEGWSPLHDYYFEYKCSKLKNMKSAEIIENYPDQVESGRVFIFDIAKATKNPDIVQLPVAQAREGENFDPFLSASMEGVFSTKRIRLEWAPFAKKVVDDMDVTPGAYLEDAMIEAGKLPEGTKLGLFTTEYTSETNQNLYKRNVQKPSDEGVKGASHKINPSTGVPITFNGQPIYQTNFVAAVGSVRGRDTMLQGDHITERQVAAVAESRGTTIESMS